MAWCVSSAADERGTAMRDEEIDARLQRWAQAVTVGDGSGYPSMSVIHPNWMPPTKGTTPVMKTTSKGGDVLQTVWAIDQLSLRLKNSVVVYYCMKLPIADQAALLDCAESTVHARVKEARRQIGGFLAAGGGVFAT